jgi:phenylacetate-coenzyme A ligase PaaK-like adenylate-forming protein
MSDPHRHTWELLRLASIYEPSPERDALFTAALAETTRWHLERNAPYRRFCQSRGSVLERDPRTPGDLEHLPALAADVFKAFDLATLRHVRFFTVSSSGTAGRRTTIPLDVETVRRMWAMGEATFRAEGLFSDEPVDYVILAPDPRTSPGHGNAQFFQALTAAAPARETFHALVPDSTGGLRFDVDGAAARLARCATARRPVRVLGLPALVVRLARCFAKGPVSLAESSLVLTGAGWKGEALSALPKAEVRELVSSAWGLPGHRLRDLYGMTEHAVHYLECREHRFHAPVFARVRVVDPLDGRPVPDGETGVLHLMNPGFTTMPFHSLLTADVGRRVGACSCGRGTPAFEVIGRGGTSSFRGCAATTLEAVAS